MAQDGSAQWRRSLRQATQLLDAGQLRQAEQMFLQLLEEQPNSAEATVLLALTQVRIRWQFRSNKLVSKALALEPENPRILRLAAMVYFGLRQPATALNLLDKAVRLAPRDATIHGQYARYFLAKRDQKRAKMALDEALRLSPNSAEFLRLKQQYEELYYDPKVAQVTAQEQLRLDPESLQGHLAAGRAALGMGNVDQAYWHYREALRQEPNSDDARAALLEALRHRYKLYNWLYRFRIATAKYRFNAPFFVAFLVVRLLGALWHAAKDTPAAGAAANVLAILFGAAFLLFLAPMPLITILLNFHPIGKYALSKLEKFECWLTLAMLLTIIVSAAVGLRTAVDAYWIPAGMAGLSFFALSLVVGFRSPKSRTGTVIFIAVLWVFLEILSFTVFIPNSIPPTAIHIKR